MTAADVEETRWALQFSDSESLEKVEERIKRRAEWDKQHPTGEGTTVERKRAIVDGKYQWVDDPCTYQWVGVTDDKGKIQGTFYIRHHDGEVLELFLVPARKGIRPNPYDRSGISQAAWSKPDAEEAREWEEELARRAAMTQEERERRMRLELDKLAEVREFSRQQNPEELDDLEAYRDDFERIRRAWSGEIHQDTRPLTTDHRADQGRLGPSEARKVSGQRPTVNIQPETALNGDVRFKFREGQRGFRVRGSKLGPVLLRFRQAGLQRVTARMIQAAIEHVA